MKVQAFVITGFLALNVYGGTTRDLSGLEEQCRRDIEGKCRELELAKKIDYTLFTGEHAKYKWVLGPSTVASIVPRNAADRRSQMKQAACSYLAEVWIDPIVEEYGRLVDQRAVDRRAFDLCMAQSL
jgi:hypothetical protein